MDVVTKGRRTLMATAMAVFVFTVAIGILNGTDAYEPDHDVLMSHVHSGTLGWISLSVLAAALGLFGSRLTGWRATVMRWLPAATAVAVVAYVTAFVFSHSVVRPIVGTGTLAVVLLWFAWVFAQRREVVVSVPRLAVLAAITSLLVGAVLGILLGLEIAGHDVLPDGGEDAHPAAMVIGFLIPIGMAVAEWRLRPELLETPADRAGRLQVGLPFLGGLFVMVGLLTDFDPLIMMSLPFEIVGVGIFLKRMWPAIRAVDWRRGGWERGGALTAFYLVGNIAFFVYLVSKYPEDLGAAPSYLLLALDHLMFVGVMTNSLFGLLDVIAERRVWARNDDYVLAGMNVGLLIFVVGLLAESAAIKRIGTPIMGTAILVGLATFARRLFSSPSTERAAAASR